MLLKRSFETGSMQFVFVVGCTVTASKVGTHAAFHRWKQYSSLILAAQAARRLNQRLAKVASDEEHNSAIDRWYMAP